MELIVIRTFLTHEECNFLRYQHVGMYIEDDPYWSGRTMWGGIKWNREICLKLLGLEDTVHTHYQVPVRLTSPHLVKWPKDHPGMSPHSDYGSDNEFPFREFSAVINLNDEYEGGTSIFPQLKRQVTLRKGDLLICNGGKVLHGVDPVLKSDRYTLLMWFIPTEQFTVDIEPLPYEFTKFYE